MNQPNPPVSQPTASRRPHYRRRVIVNGAFQWKYALTLGLTVFFVSCILSCSLFAVLHDQARQRMMSPRGDSANAAYTMLAYAMGFSAIASAAVGFWIMVGTRRICGPLILLDRHFREMAGGKFPSLRPLRRKDEFKDLFRTFGFAVERFRSDKKAELELVVDAIQSARAGAHADDDGCRQALTDVTQQLYAIRKMLEESLGTGESKPRPKALILSESGSAAPTRTKRNPVGVA